MHQVGSSERKPRGLKAQLDALEARVAMLEQQGTTTLASQTLPIPDARRMAVVEEEELLEGVANG